MGVNREDRGVGFLVASLLAPGSCGMVWEDDPPGCSFAWGPALPMSETAFSLLSFPHNNNNNPQETKLLLLLSPCPTPNHISGSFPGKRFPKKQEFCFFTVGKMDHSWKKLPPPPVSRDFSWHIFFSPHLPFPPPLLFWALPYKATLPTQADAGCSALSSCSSSKGHASLRWLFWLGYF